MTDADSRHGMIPVEADERVTELLGYCPHCPINEGLRTHERLNELSREFRQCPRCKRLYCVSQPAPAPTGAAEQNCQQGQMTCTVDKRAERAAPPCWQPTPGEAERLAAALEYGLPHNYSAGARDFPGTLREAAALLRRMDENRQADIHAIRDFRARAEQAEAELATWRQSFACCEAHTPDLWEGDGTCVICEAVHIQDRALEAEAALAAKDAEIERLKAWHPSGRGHAMSQKLAPLSPPSVEFLEELRERARRYGWSGDYVEIRDFVQALYVEAGFAEPDLRAYELDSDDDLVSFNDGAAPAGEDT